MNTSPATASRRVVDRFDHGRFDAVLQRFVDGDGLVDYAGLARDRAELDACLDKLADVDLTALVDDAERMAYWINAYNAITLAGILHHYPVASVCDLRGFWGRIKADCGGRIVTLDDIEHAILRPLGDPRIHMAINCASMSCPRLWDRAYTGAELDTWLELAARAFLGDPQRNRFDGPSRRAHLSKIFSWFAEDFAVPPYSGVAGFVRQHAPSLPWPNDDFEIAYLRYDRSLNEQPPGG